jgi:hypothetical protein
MGRLKYLFFCCVKNSAFILFLFPGALYTFGQTASLNQFLKSSLDDPYYRSFDLQSAYLNKAGNYSLPWLEELQFRYRDNEFQNIEQRYSFRFEPGNPWQIGQNKKYFQGILTIKSMEQKLVLKNILKDRYELVAAYWMAIEQANLIDLQKRKREEIGNAMARKVGSSGFDPDQYLNSQIDIISKAADWHEAILERDVALSKINSVSGDMDFNLSISDLISIDQINQLIQSDRQAINQTELDFLQQRIALSDQKIKLE